MSDPRRELWKALDALDHHARRITALSTEVRAQLVGLSIKPPEAEGFSCLCDRVFLTERELALHQANVHDGPPVPLDEAELAG